MKWIKCLLSIGTKKKKWPKIDEINRFYGIKSGQIQKYERKNTKSNRETELLTKNKEMYAECYRVSH